MNKKLKRTLMIVYILTIIVMLAGATLSYFTTLRVSNLNPIIEASTATTDHLTLTTGDPIYINANGNNFGEDMGDLSDTTYGNVNLRVVNAGSAVTYKYNVYINIESNDLIYTVNENTPELLLKVTDPTGNELTSISGLEYKEVTNGEGSVIQGFDITGVTGRFDIASNFEITSSSEANHTWQIEVILVNLTTNQDNNLEKMVDAYLRLERVDENGRA